MLKEEILIARIKEKDNEAFNELYDAYNERIFYYIYKIVKDSEATRELTQDTFIALYEKIDQYNGGSFTSWIYTIAKNKALNYYNRVIKKNKELLDSIITVESIYNDTNEELKDISSKPLGKFDELLDRYFSPEDKEIVIMYIVLRYTFKEISEIMNIPLKRLTKRYKQILETLKLILKTNY